MKLACPFPRFSLGFIFLAALSFSWAGRAHGQNPSTSGAPAPASSDDAAAKAAERKKHFEDAKKQLENEALEPPPQPLRPPQVSTNVAQSGPPPVAEPLVFTLDVTMAIGETQRFRLYDYNRQDLTTKAAWSVSDPDIAELSLAGGSPSLVGKKAGTTFVLASANSYSARVVLNVVYRDQIAKATRWNQNEIETGTLLKIVPAIPQLAPRR